MFNLASFIKNGFISAVGKMADYQIILNSAGWFEKGVLNEADLAEIQSAIEEKNARIEAEESHEEVVEEPTNIDEPVDLENEDASSVT